MSWKSMMMAAAVAKANPDLGDAEDIAEVTEEDAVAIRMLIRKQLVAFSTSDVMGAWSLCSQPIRETFRTPERMFEVIRSRYPALAAPREVAFGGFRITPEGLAQTFQVVDDQGVAHHGLYLVRREEGAWRVNGAMLLPAMAEAA